MTEVKKLSGNLQNNVLAMLIFSPEKGSLVRNAVPTDFWSGEIAFKLLIESIYSYYDLYTSAPETHIDDLVESLSIGEDHKELLQSIITTCREIYPSIHEKFVLNDLKKFYVQSQISTNSMKAIDLSNQGKLEEAESFLRNALNNPFTLFDKGSTLLSHIEKRLTEPAINPDNVIPWGIPTLDDYFISPLKHTSFLIAGVINSGKSFAVIHLAKQALLKGKKVLHITLEMSEDQVLDRYAQALFNYSKFPIKTPTQTIINDSQFEEVKTADTPSILNQATWEDAITQIENQLYLEKHLIVKEFPTSGLSLNELISYVDGLQSAHNFIPDVLIVDSPKVMKLKYKSKQQRTDELLAAIYNELRGHFAQERDTALVVTHQLKQDAYNKLQEGKELDINHIGESWAMLEGIDQAVFFGSTQLEKQYGLTRLFAKKVRFSAAPSVCISQDLNRGLFVTGSANMDKGFRELHKQHLSILKSGGLNDV